MVALTALWLPILLSAVAVFFASFVLHMVLRYHWNDYTQMPGEEKVMDAMRAEGLSPGNYHFPKPHSMKELQSPEMVKKFERGPVGFIHVLPSGPPTMGKQLTLWFLFSVVVGVLVAYITGLTLAPGTDYRMVFRIASAVAFLAYAVGEPINSIWKGARWNVTLKAMFDGLVYALLTGGVFGWLWPS